MRASLGADPGRLRLGFGERDVAVGLRVGLEAGLVPGRLGQRARAVRLGVGRAAHAGFEALRGQLGLPLGRQGWRAAGGQPAAGRADPLMKTCGWLLRDVPHLLK